MTVEKNWRKTEKKRLPQKTLRQNNCRKKTGVKMTAAKHRRKNDRCENVDAKMYVSRLKYLTILHLILTMHVIFSSFVRKT